MASIPEPPSPLPMLTSPPPPGPSGPPVSSNMPVFPTAAAAAARGGLGAFGASHPGLMSHYYQMMADKLWGTGLISPPGSDSSQHSDKSNGVIVSSGASTSGAAGQSNFFCLLSTCGRDRAMTFLCSTCEIVPTMETCLSCQHCHVSSANHLGRGQVCHAKMVKSRAEWQC